MRKMLSLLAVLAMTGLVIASCGGGGGGEEDTRTDGTDVTDQTDQVTDTPGDRPADTPTDNPTDIPAEVVPDGQPDVVPDTQPDVAPDVEPDGELPPSQCVENGGYCTTYAIIEHPCVLCPEVGEDHYKPSRPTDDAMGCTVEGEGAGPWCCVLANPTDPDSCEAGGGECYPGGGDNICPLGWVENTDLDCNGAQRCCAPGPDCTTP